LTGKKDDVKKAFDEAISLLARSGFTRYGAIANECLGKYMLRNNDQFWAECYLSQAAGRYAEWGAAVKVNRLFASYPFIPPESIEFVSSAHRGHTRYNPATDSLNPLNPLNPLMPKFQKQVSGV
jgi:hypothetical protein